MNWRCLPFTAMEILWGFVGPRCLYLNVAYAGEILALKSAFATDPLCLKYQLEVTKAKYIEVDGLLRSVGRPSFCVQREATFLLPPGSRIRRRPPVQWRLDSEIACSRGLLDRLLPAPEWTVCAIGYAAIIWQVHRIWAADDDRLDQYLFIWGDY